MINIINIINIMNNIIIQPYKKKKKTFFGRIFGLLLQ